MDHAVNPAAVPGTATALADLAVRSVALAADSAELGGFTSRSMLTMAAVLTILIMILGVSGNLLTIVALLRCPRVRNVAAAFIIRWASVLVVRVLKVAFKRASLLARRGAGIRTRDHHVGPLPQPVRG